MQKPISILWSMFLGVLLTSCMGGTNPIGDSSEADESLRFDCKQRRIYEEIDQNTITGSPAESVVYSVGQYDFVFVVQLALSVVNEDSMFLRTYYRVDGSDWYEGSGTTFYDDDDGEKLNSPVEGEELKIVAREEHYTVNFEFLAYGVRSVNECEEQE